MNASSKKKTPFTINSLISMNVLVSFSGDVHAALIVSFLMAPMAPGLPSI